MEMTTEVRTYYSKFLAPFLHVVEEVGLEETMKMVAEQLQKDIEIKKDALRQAQQMLDNTKKLASQLGVTVE